MLEMVIVIAIIGVVAAIAAPRFGQAQLRYRADMASRRIADELRFASEYARANECEVEATIDSLTEIMAITATSGDHAGEIAAKIMLDAAPYEANLFLSQRGDVFGSPQFTAEGLAVADTYVAVMAGTYYVIVGIGENQSTVERSELRVWGGASVDLSVGGRTTNVAGAVAP